MVMSGGLARLALAHGGVNQCQMSHLKSESLQTTETRSCPVLNSGRRRRVSLATGPTGFSFGAKIVETGLSPFAAARKNTVDDRLISIELLHSLSGCTCSVHKMENSWPLQRRVVHSLTMTYVIAKLNSFARAVFFSSEPVSFTMVAAPEGEAKGYQAHLDQQLRQAAGSGKISSIASLIAAGANPEHVDDDTGLDTVHTAARFGREDAIRELKRLGVSLLSQVANREFAIHTAARWGQAHVLAFLLSSGVNIDLTDSLNRTALFHAVWRGQHSAVRTLIEWGADPSVRAVGGRTALMQAVKSNDQASIEMLLFAIVRQALLIQHPL